MFVSTLFLGDGARGGDAGEGGDGGNGTHVTISVDEAQSALLWLVEADVRSGFGAHGGTGGLGGRCTYISTYISIYIYHDL